MARLFAAQPANDLPQVPNFNVCPTTQVHVVRVAETGRHLVPMRWGFLPHWYKTETGGPLLINARAETIAEKPAFKSACRDRRCIVVASGFYEWTKDADGKRLPWYIFRADVETIAFAGIWQDWGKGEERKSTCAIVTTAANVQMARIHNRMPLILDPADWPLWLGESGKGAANLMRPAREDLLQYYRVDPAVNSNRARGPHLIEPLDAGAS